MYVVPKLPVNQEEYAQCHEWCDDADFEEVAGAVDDGDGEALLRQWFEPGHSFWGAGVSDARPGPDGMLVRKWPFMRENSPIDRVF